MTEPYFKIIDLWSPTEEYTNHRIPGMIVTKRKTLIAYCEARRASGDWACMDILMQRSENFGEGFGEPVILAKGTDEHKTVNNPVIRQCI